VDPPEEKDQKCADIERTVAKQVGLEQRREPVPRFPALVEVEPDESDWGRGQHRDRPPGPAALRSLDQRQHQQQHGECAQRDTRKVKPLALAGTHVGQHQRCQENGHDPNWEVHQKDRTPREAEQVSLDEDSPKDEPCDVGKADRHAHPAERCRTLGTVGKGHPHQCKDWARASPRRRPAAACRQ
jgi:hypothetical protein